jgi:hypothetical protein
MRGYLMMAGVVLVVAAASSYLAIGGQQGNDPMGGGMMGGGMMGGGMMNRGGPQQGMMGNNPNMMPMMRGMMAQGMAQSITQEGLVATSDGGVVVLAGGKLMKYDSSLNLVKEVELKVDYENMQQRMQKMMESVPMMRGGMMRGSGGNSGNDATQP